MTVLPPLTAEQHAIVHACPRRGDKAQLSKITAAAGSGKTTTLVALAVHATTSLGHNHITYVTFTKAAAADGKKRIEAAVVAAHDPDTRPTVDAFTLHACAQKLLLAHLNQADISDSVGETEKMWTRKEIEDWIVKTCADEIARFGRECRDVIYARPCSSNSHRHQYEKATSQIVFFIYKSLLQFCQSKWSVREYEEGTVFGRDYYPMKKFHDKGGEGEEYGFVATKYHKSESLAFYAKQAARLWALVVQQDLRCYDFEMKRVQLLKLRVAGSLILVDESQDMDECQIDWIATTQSLSHKTSVMVVGDPAQAIYGFRGAKPKCLMSLRCHRTYMLTESWRFGPAISNIANLVLYSKEKSKQTDAYKKKWVPFRTRASLPYKEALVTSQPLIQQWESGPVTVIARANVALFIQALDLVGFSHKDTGEVKDEPKNGRLPKIHILGRGEGSGLKLWTKALDLVGSVYDLFKQTRLRSDYPYPAPILLDSTHFPEFAGRAVTWDSFIDECEQKEIRDYNTVIGVVSKFREKTHAAVQFFRDHIMNQPVSEDEADIVLVTCHSAKGLEWDRVQVCNDFIELCSFEKKAGSSAPFSRQAKNRRLDDAWQLVWL